MEELFSPALRTGLTLVTGGAGFIGSNLVDAIRQIGGSVRVLDNFSTGFPANLSGHEGDAAVEVIEGDASDPATARAAMEGVDFVFHQAAMASVPRSMRQPALCHAWCATSTVQLLEAAASGNRVQRFVLASTSAAYGDSPFVAKRETDPVAPLSPYAAAKLAAEGYCRAFHAGFAVPTVVLRYFNVFGPKQDPGSEYSAVIPRFVSLILEGRSPVIYGDGSQSRDFVFVEDVVRANLLAATVPEAVGGTFNVGQGERTTLLHLLEILAEILGEQIRPIHEPPRAGDIRDSQADISEARRRLTFAPQTSIRSGLQRSIAFYRRLVASR